MMKCCIGYLPGLFAVLAQDQVDVAGTDIQLLSDLIVGEFLRT
ncbi:hypothetical protein [Atlantibacter hermannii]|nr:hypothetical protein [Atlantibacter hermannii]MCQ4968560.1 hypothetical protein [Enterobacteriaceae bacterium DFI.7.85]